MVLTEKVTEDWKQALKDKDELKKVTLSTLRGVFKNAEIEKRAPITNEEAIKLIKKEASKRHDAKDAYVKAGREDLANKEYDEATLLERYLPIGLSEAEIQFYVNAEISKYGEAVSMKNMGTIVKAVIAQTNGAADGKTVSTLVKQAIESA